jgi:hypothetical protein
MGGVGAAVRAWAAPETRYAHSPAIEPGRAAAAHFVRRVLRVMPHSERQRPGSRWRQPHGLSLRATGRAMSAVNLR